MSEVGLGYKPEELPKDFLENYSNYYDSDEHLDIMVDKIKSAIYRFEPDNRPDMN
jgi:hypothetical protein